MVRPIPDHLHTVTPRVAAPSVASAEDSPHGNRLVTPSVESVGVDERSREVERRLEKPLLAFALLTIPAIALDQPGVAEPWKGIGIALNWVIWLAFLAEVVIMLWVVPDRRQWLRDHPLDLAIVILTPPVLPPALQAARLFRLLRLLRLVRAATLARHIFTTEGIRDAAILTFVAVLGGGAAFAAVENKQDLSTWDGIWWAIQTVTTVGYGDTPVETDGGRVLAICLMITGIGFVAVLTASAADRFMRGRQRAEERARAEREAIEGRLDQILARLDAIERR